MTDETKNRSKLMADIGHIVTRLKNAQSAVELVLSAPNLLPNERAWKEHLLFQLKQAEQFLHQALEVARANGGSDEP